MVKTWIELETTLSLEDVSLVGAHLLGVQVIKFEPSLSSLNRKPRVGWVKVHLWKPYALPITQVEQILSIACRAIEIIRGSK